MRMAKNQKDFRRFSSASTAIDKIENVTNNEFIWIWCDLSTYLAQLVFMYNDGKEILYNT